MRNTVCHTVGRQIASHNPLMIYTRIPLYFFLIVRKQLKQSKGLLIVGISSNVTNGKRKATNGTNKISGTIFEISFVLRIAIQ